MKTVYTGLNPKYAQMVLDAMKADVMQLVGENKFEEARDLMYDTEFLLEEIKNARWDEE